MLKKLSKKTSFILIGIVVGLFVGVSIKQAFGDTTSVPPAPTITSSFTPSTIPSNGFTVYQYDSQNTTHCVTSHPGQTGGWDNIITNASFPPTTFYASQFPNGLTTTITCYNAAGQSAESTKTLTVTAATTDAATTPTITSFIASPTSIISGQSTTLSWTSAGAVTHTLSTGAVVAYSGCILNTNETVGLGSFQPNGSLTVSPKVTTTYGLLCQKYSPGPYSPTSHVTVTVTAATPDHTALGIGGTDPTIVDQRNGNLAVNIANVYQNGLLVPYGNVGIGVVNPTVKLDVNGYVKSTTAFCIGTTCIDENQLKAMLGIGTTVTPPPVTPTSYNLTVTKAGAGAGVIDAPLHNISCGRGSTACSATSANGTSVVLTAYPDIPGTFAGWSGDCSGTSIACTVIMSGDKNVTATFTSDGGNGNAAQDVTKSVTVSVTGSNSNGHWGQIETEGIGVAGVIKENGVWKIRLGGTLRNQQYSREVGSSCDVGSSNLDYNGYFESAPPVYYASDNGSETSSLSAAMQYGLNCSADTAAECYYVKIYRQTCFPN